MGLFDDTIRDARRPLPGTWVRREPLPERETPEEEVLEPAAPAGMTTIFRFQKGGPLPAMEGGSREASFRLGVGESDLPAGDPLSVGSEVEKPDFSAKDVNGNRDIISVLGDNRGNELATGQVNHGSPGKRTAAEMATETRKHRSVVVPGPIESGFVHQTHKPQLPEGSGRFVSEREETYQSRASGQGAPSDSFSAPVPPLRPAQPGMTVAGQAVGTDGPRSPAVPLPGVADAGQGDGATEAATVSTGDEQLTSHGGKPLGEGRTASRPAPPIARGAAMIPPSGPGLPMVAERMAPVEAPPRLVIGRIEVVVVNKEQQPSTRSGTSARTDTGFVSRNYLKRL